MTDKKKQTVDFSKVEINEGMVCGPDGCSLADHFDWAKKKQEDKK
ncbi:hypothetical protein [Lactobacillus agrestimuris]|nr:hypothetical protein [Lactobacillus agrestimuris]